MSGRDVLNILLVDDQPAKLLSYETILQSLGENLLKARSATEALEYLLHHEVAVILIDVCMPDLDGYELARMIREHPRHQRTSIVFVSAVLMTDLDRLRGYQCGAVDYVPVPVVPEILRAKVSVFADLYRKTHQLEQLNRELEQRVADRTAALEASATELRRKEEHLRLALDVGRMGTWELNARTGIVTWDVSQHELYGIGGEQRVTVDRFFANVVPEDLAGMKEALERALQQGTAFSREFRVRQRDGSVRWLASRGDVVPNRERRSERLIGVTFDITDQKRSEEALQEADRRKDEFIAMLAHELRNPLAPIRTAAQLMRLKELPEARRDRAREMIERQIDHLVRLIDDLLDVSRITRGLIALQPQLVELGPIITHAADTARPTVDSRQQTLTIEVPETPILVEADPTRLAQAIGNVLHNAAKFTADRGEISIRASVEDGQATIRIRDNGVGIPKPALSKIFDLFAKGDYESPATQPGLGIGLSLVRRFMEMHNGTVVAESDGPGTGSQFTLRLPVSTERRALETRGRTASAPPPPQAPCRVLVVDDNEDAAESVSLLLRLAGHDTRVEHDGVRALAAAEEFRPDLVLLDLRMPNMDGYETARRLRQRPHGRHLALVALSGWSSERHRHESQKAGFNAHLVKPVDETELLKLVSELSAKAPRRRAVTN